jgi:N-acetylglucosamine-6-phosphate deacetylase
VSESVVHCPRLFDGWAWHEGVRLRVHAGRVVALEAGKPPQPGDRALPEGTVVAPGPVDIQLNGGGGRLFNAMSQLSAREPGAVGAALLHPLAWAGLVLDGFHVAPGSVAVLRAARGLDRVALVSDAMPPAGSDASEFMLQGRRIRVEGRRCVDEHGTLAGASITLADAVRIAIEACGFALHEALACAARVPAELLGRSDLGVLNAGASADVIVFDRGWRPVGVMQHGRWTVEPQAPS